MLYVSIGSSCNDCAEAGKDRATLQRFNLGGTGRTVYARGVRDTIGFGWHPETRMLWGADNGSDWKGDGVPPEELNQISEGGNYGWPLCYGKRVVDTATTSEPKQVIGKEMSKEDYCAATVGSVLEFPAHYAPIGMTFYNGQQFPAEFRGDAFVAFHGSWNREAAEGYKVVRVRFRNGQPTAYEDFLTGFLTDSGRSFLGRPAGIAVAADGSLLVSDDTGGVLYRISYAPTWVTN
jgi:glucose/arabinose dehydrogenase